MRGRMPLKLVFIIIAAVVVNAAIIVSVHMLLWFDPAENLDPGHPASIDSRFEDYRLIDTYVDKDESNFPWENYFTFHLLENPEGERLLAVVENHFLFSRVRYREDLTMEVPDFASNQAPVFGTNLVRMGYSCTLAPDGTIEQAHTHGQSGPDMLLILVPLLIAEYLGFIFLFRREEIA